VCCTPGTSTGRIIKQVSFFRKHYKLHDYFNGVIPTGDDLSPFEFCSVIFIRSGKSLPVRPVERSLASRDPICRMLIKCTDYLPYVMLIYGICRGKSHRFQVVLSRCRFCFPVFRTQSSQQCSCNRPIRHVMRTASHAPGVVSGRSPESYV